MAASNNKADSRVRTEAQAAWLDIPREEFLAALRRFKPARMRKAYLNKELQIGLLEGQAILCIEGLAVRLPAQGHWPGCVCVPFGLLLPYLRIPPASDPVRLEFRDERLHLGTTRYAASWRRVLRGISPDGASAAGSAQAPGNSPP